MATSEIGTSKIAAKLVSAMKAVDAVEKKGRNTLQGYNFVRATDVANEVRKALYEIGVAFTYSVISERTWEAPTNKGSLQFFCSLIVEVTFTDSDSGESISARSIGWGGDMQDKAPYKAMTGALKYALRMNFLIPDESDPENSETHESVAPPDPEHVVIASKIEEWKTKLATAQTPGDFNAYLVAVRGDPAPVRKFFIDTAENMGFVFDPKTSKFIAKPTEQKEVSNG